MIETEIGSVDKRILSKIKDQSKKIDSVSQETKDKFDELNKV